MVCLCSLYSPGEDAVILHTAAAGTGGLECEKEAPVFTPSGTFSYS